MHVDHFIEVVCGGMFSGKTTELIQRVKRYNVSGIPVQVFKPSIENRYDEKNVVSHDGIGTDALPVRDTAELNEKLQENTRIVGLEETQFFDSAIVPFCQGYAARGGVVIAAFLLNDYMARPFRFSDKKGSVLELIAIADHIKMLQGICTQEIRPGVKCSRDAVYSQKFIDGKIAPPAEDVVAVGGAETYAARCRVCYVPYDR